MRYELQEQSLVRYDEAGLSFSRGTAIFMQSQKVLKSVRQATRVLGKERLLLTIRELAELKEKLEERKEQCRSTPEEKADGGESSSGEDDRAEVSNLKNALLLDICKILT